MTLDGSYWSRRWRVPCPDCPVVVDFPALVAIGFVPDIKLIHADDHHYADITESEHKNHVFPWSQVKAARSGGPAPTCSICKAQKETA